jgi:hypothetical protein
MLGKESGERTSREGGSMSGQLAVVPTLDDGPVHRSIIAVDVEGSTQRTNPERGELRRIMYALLDRALRASGIDRKHLEHPADRGDGVLLLIRPHDHVPKTLLLGQLIPKLTALLFEHNATVVQPDLRIRLRAVLHAGDIHDDGWGFYGEDLDVAFRLLNSPTVKRALRNTPASPLVLVVSDVIHFGIVRHGYVDGGPYEQSVYVRVGGRRWRGWVNFPAPARAERMLTTGRAKTPLRSPPLVIAPAPPLPERRAAGDLPLVSAHARR